MQKLIEDSRAELLNKSKRGKNYSGDQSKGKNRFQRRLKSSIMKSVNNYNRLDMNKFFKQDTLDVVVKVHGETNDYEVKIRFNGILDELHKILQSGQEFNFRSIAQALIRAFNREDVFIHCSCLHPDTKIKLLDGTSPTVKELKQRFDSGEALYVYSVDKNGDFKPGVVENVFITKVTREFIKVTLDNGSEIITTPDHLYMMRDGSWRQAQELSPTDSLMPLYFNTYQNGYDGVKLNSTGKYHSVYKLVAEYFKSDEISTARSRVLESDGMKYEVAIHHIDFNKHNNNPENLLPMTAKEHWMYHANCNKSTITDQGREKLRKLAQERNSNPTPAMIESRKKFVQRGTQRNYDEDRRLQQAEIMRESMKRFYSTVSPEKLEQIRLKSCTQEWKDKISKSNKQVWSSYSEEEYKNRCEINRIANQKSKEKRSLAAKNVRKNKTEEELSTWAKKCGATIKELWRTNPEVFMTEKRKASNKLKGQYKRTAETTYKCNLTKISNTIQKILDAGETPTPETYLKYKTGGIPNYTSCFEDWQELAQYFNLNHSVVSVERILLEDTPVYDISVKDHHNFLVDAGVILHNCEDWRYRFAYWSTVEKINSGQTENRPNRFDWTNKNNDMGAACKHVLLVLANNTWLNKVASVIFNYVNYMKDHSQKMYADIVYPAIYEKPYEDDVQISIFDKDDLDTEESDIDTSNRYARTKTQFQKGNQSGVQFAKEDNPNEKQLDIDSL